MRKIVKKMNVCVCVCVRVRVLQEILDSLAELYSLLQEEDMWAGLWQKRCKFPETSTAIAYEQHGFFEQVSTGTHTHTHTHTDTLPYTQTCSLIFTHIAQSDTIMHNT